MNGVKRNVLGMPKVGHPLKESEDESALMLKVNAHISAIDNLTQLQIATSLKTKVLALEDISTVKRINATFVQAKEDHIARLHNKESTIMATKKTFISSSEMDTFASFLRGDANKDNIKTGENIYLICPYNWTSMN